MSRIRRTWRPKLLGRSCYKPFLTAPLKVTWHEAWWNISLKTCLDDGCPMEHTMICTHSTVLIKLQQGNRLHQLAHFTEFSRKVVGKRNWDLCLPAPIRSAVFVTNWNLKYITPGEFKNTQRQPTNCFDILQVNFLTGHATTVADGSQRQLMIWSAWSRTQWIRVNSHYQDTTGANLRKTLRPLTDPHWKWPLSWYTELEFSLIYVMKIKIAERTGCSKPWTEVYSMRMTFFNVLANQCRLLSRFGQTILQKISWQLDPGSNFHLIILMYCHHFDSEWFWCDHNIIVTESSIPDLPSPFFIQPAPLRKLRTQSSGPGAAQWHVLGLFQNNIPRTPDSWSHPWRHRSFGSNLVCTCWHALTCLQLTWHCILNLDVSWSLRRLFRIIVAIPTRRKMKNCTSLT